MKYELRDNEMDLDKLSNHDLHQHYANAIKTANESYGPEKKMRNRSQADVYLEEIKKRKITKKSDDYYFFIGHCDGEGSI